MHAADTAGPFAAEWTPVSYASVLLVEWNAVISGSILMATYAGFEDKA